MDKIVGPGNLYVTAAKKLVAFDCAIDFLAGPTEVVILSDDGEPAFIASDLVAQAEHDPDAAGASYHAIAKAGASGLALGERPWRRETRSRSSRCESMEPFCWPRPRTQAIDWANRLRRNIYHHGENLPSS